jgi:ribosomal protein L16 Arg81 hydroxylase
MSTSVTSLLLGPLSPREFIERHWNASRPLHVGGARDRFEPLCSEEAIRAAFAAPSCEIRIGFPRNVAAGNPLLPRGARAPSWGTAQVPRRSVDRLFQAGGTINLVGLDGCCPPAARLSRALQAELCFPGSVVSEALISPPGSGFSAYHIDPVASFTLQLAGSKTWDVCRAPAVEWPLHNAQLDASGNPFYHLRSTPPAEWEKLPAVDQAEVDTFRLEPGSFLYVPPGHWHRARAGDSVSVSLLFYFQDDRDLTVAHLLDRLYADPAFRRLPIGWHEEAGGALHRDVAAHYRYRLAAVARLLKETP